MLLRLPLTLLRLLLRALRLLLKVQRLLLTLLLKLQSNFRITEIHKNKINQRQGLSPDERIGTCMTKVSQVFFMLYRDYGN